MYAHAKYAIQWLVVILHIGLLGAVENGRAKEIGQPLWELGAGAGGGWNPDYPAADENSFNGIPFPYIVYRGDFWRVGGREGIVRGRFLNTDRYEFDLSMSGAFPVDSDDNEARRGMPDLDFLIGIGPQLKVKLFENPEKNNLSLNLQLRSVFSTDIKSVATRGYVFNPKFVYRHKNLTDQKLRLFLSAGPIFATRKLMDYFYKVGPEFETPTRPEFNPEGGYLGSQISLGFSTRRPKKFRFFLGTSIGIYKGATNEDSPLFRDDLTVGVFGGFIWTIWQSKQKVAEW